MHDREKLIVAAPEIPELLATLKETLAIIRWMDPSRMDTAGYKTAEKLAARVEMILATGSAPSP